MRPVLSRGEAQKFAAVAGDGRVQKEFYYDDQPECAMWDTMWTTRTIEQELKACEMEGPPRELFMQFLSKKDRIIDAGCGFGKWVIYLHQRGYDILGMDSNELAVSKLREFDGTLKVEAGDILNTHYPDCSFDAYLSMGVVEHFEEGPQAALHEAYRILKPGGLIFVSVPTVNVVRRIYRRPLRHVVHSILRSMYAVKSQWGTSRSKAFFNAVDVLVPEGVRRILSGGKGRYYHFTEYRYTRQELEGFLARAGFEVMKTIPHDFLDSRDHAIGLVLDFPFLGSLKREPNFKLNMVGKLVSRILDGISPWVACANIICVGRSLKKSD